MSFSIIIPVFNEEESIGFVLDEIREHHPEAEIIVIDDGSTDGTAGIARGKNVRVVSHGQNLGQSHATWNGLHAASHELCVLMDGDGECDPKDIKKLIEAAGSADFVCGYRVNRKRSLLNRMASKVGNSIRRLVTGDSAQDTGAMKLIRKKHIKHLHLFDGMHRFIPSFLKHNGLIMSETPISPRKRIGGKTKYTVHERALRGIKDLHTVNRILKTYHA